LKRKKLKCKTQKIQEFYQEKRKKYSFYKGPQNSKIKNFNSYLIIDCLVDKLPLPQSTKILIQRLKGKAKIKAFDLVIDEILEIEVLKIEKRLGDSYLKHINSDRIIPAFIEFYKQRELKSYNLLFLENYLLEQMIDWN
jgi:hypothetical protein